MMLLLLLLQYSSERSYCEIFNIVKSIKRFESDNCVRR
jgi:hypothetical protein